MPRKPVVIDNPSELDRLRVVPGLRSPGLGRIQLATAQDLDPETRSDFEKRLNGHYFACGCDTAALFIVIAIVGSLTLIVAGGADNLGKWSWLLGFLLVLVAAALGKFVGKLRAERQFRQVVAELKRVWRVPVKTSEQISNCG